MLLFLFSIILATAAGVTAFLFVSTGSMKSLKNCLLTTNRLPMVMPDGNVVNTKEDLEAHLEVLEKRLVEKAGELDASKLRENDTKESIEKLASTQIQVKQYYMKLKEEIKRSEDEFRNLQEQIDDYRLRRIELEVNLKKNEEYYRDLLDSVNIKPGPPDSLAASAGKVKSKPVEDEKSAKKKSKGQKREPSPAGSTETRASPQNSARSTPLQKVNSSILRKQLDLNLTEKTPSNTKCNVEKEEPLSKPTGDVKSPQKGTAGKPPKETFPVPVGLCYCGSSLCQGNCSLAKELKICFETAEPIWQTGNPQGAKKTTNASPQKPVKPELEAKSKKPLKNFKF